jgi:hypothetical protein
VLAASIIRAMMEAVSTSETSVNFYQTIRLNNPEDSHLLDLKVCFSDLLLGEWFIKGCGAVEM